MARRPWTLRLPRLLLGVTLALSAGLVVLVMLSPLLDKGGVTKQGWPRFWAVFARDRTLRRTAVASALGLAVTAWVFFRTPSAPRPAVPRNRRLPPPPSIAGA